SKKVGREIEPETVAHSVSNPKTLSARQCRQGAILSRGDVNRPPPGSQGGFPNFFETFTTAGGYSAGFGGGRSGSRRGYGSVASPCGAGGGGGSHGCRGRRNCHSGGSSLGIGMTSRGGGIGS